jgi:predicted RNase H-like nuclease (RuvC/YqgF family)
MDVNPSELLINSTSIVGLLVVVGYVGKQLIEWFRGHKSIENQWKTTAITDAIAGHTVLKTMFDTLKEQIDELEEDLKESKRREAELNAKHRAEMAQQRQQHAEEIEALHREIRELRRQLEEYEQRHGNSGS